MANVEEEKGELQRIAYEAEGVRRQGEALQQQVSELHSTISQIDAAIESLKSMKAGAETLVLLGSGAFASAQLDAKKVVVEVGAGVFVEKEPGAAVVVLEERKKKAEELRIGMMKGVSSANRQLQELDRTAREIVGRLQKSGAIPKDEEEA